MRTSSDNQGNGLREAQIKCEAGESRISKLAILSLVLGILSLLFFVLAGIPAIVIGIISVVRVRRSRGQLKGKSIALAGVLVSIPFMCVFFLLWSLDAPPIPNDYTVADLRSAPAEYAESFEILKTLIDEDWRLPGTPAIGLTKGDVDIIDEIHGVMTEGTSAEISETLGYYAKNVEQAWTRTKKARGAISQLNAFAEIADLTGPSAHVRIMRVSNLVELAHLYQAYAHLQTEQGDIHAFTTELIELDSVLRKFSLNARLLIAKLVCHLAMADGIVTANAIANNPEASRETVELLARHFTPLTAEQISLRNSVLFEYLFTKDIINKGIGQSAIGKTPLLKRNSTMRLYRNIYDDRINNLEDIETATSARLSVWPPIYPGMEPVTFQVREPLPLLYRCYNPVGSRFIRMARSHRKSNGRTILMVQDDLLQIVLSKRLGRDVSLKARAYSDEYIVDVENRKIFSPGPDGKIDTRDDISLRINPQVLGW
ncbi:MAG: hypothetical protein CEE38_04095 [Planctomycetes bacterium B3_Pla]|nr:MAG: hypothetical protein CEE38_04095 [Planctomycetes bacterium B3_Pla]